MGDVPNAVRIWYREFGEPLTTLYMIITRPTQPPSGSARFESRGGRRELPAYRSKHTLEDCIVVEVFRKMASKKHATLPTGAGMDDTSSFAPVGFKPTQLLEIELSRPLPALTPHDDSCGQPYERGLALIKLHNRPIGSVGFDFSKAALDPLTLADRINTVLRSEIDAHLAADGLDAVPLESTGLPLAHPPRCVEERQRFLARAPFVSVIVATRDRPEQLLRCLRSLDALDYPAFETIVVDNAPSSDATERLLTDEYPGSTRVRYVREQRPGLASAHNRGLQELSGQSRIVAFTDDDVICDPLWLCELVYGFEAAESVGCVTGMIYPSELETWPQALIEQFGGFNKGYRRLVFDLHSHRPNDPLFPYAPGRFGSGANMAFRVETLKRIGGFDPVLGAGTLALGGDDLAAFFSVVVGGETLVYEPAAVVHHAHHRDYAALHRQIRGYGVGLTAYLTRSLIHRPSLLLDVARRVPLGLRYALSPNSSKNQKKRSDYPIELTALERKGMLIGPVAYFHSWLGARRHKRRRGPMAAADKER